MLLDWQVIQSLGKNGNRQNEKETRAFKHVGSKLQIVKIKNRIILINSLKYLMQQQEKKFEKKDLNLDEVIGPAEFQ